MADARTDEVLQLAKQKLGFVPNLIKELSVNPAVTEYYLEGSQKLATGVLSPKEQQAVAIAVSQLNKCTYCQAAHGAVAKGVGISTADVQAIQAGDLPSEQRLAALVTATRAVHEKRGWLGREDLSELKSVGVGRPELYEIIALIGLKTVTNYINHIARTELDPEFQETKPADACGCACC